MKPDAATTKGGQREKKVKQKEQKKTAGTGGGTGSNTGSENVTPAGSSTSTAQGHKSPEGAPKGQAHKAPGKGAPKEEGHNPTSGEAAPKIQGKCKPGGGSAGQSGDKKPKQGGHGHGHQQVAASKNVGKSSAASKPAKAKGPAPEVNKKEDIFQAVLLADNFSFSIFGPDCPLRQEGLISLANRKLIDYTLEALTVSGVQEIFVYCSSEVEEIRDHIKNSKWCAMPNCTISVIMSEDSMSLGDAMRDLDGKGVIKNDFILLSAGVVTNMALQPLLNLHRETSKEDKGAVLTLIHRRMNATHRSRPKNQNTAIVVNSKTRKVIAFDPKPTGKKLHIPLENMQDAMDIYMDSVDTGIAVCSVSVPPLFADNFDFTCMDDFIKGIMINEEILGNSIYLHRLESGYASRVVDFDTFHGISCDILQRWTYPVVPDMPFGSNQNQNIYNMHKNFVYKAANVKIAYGSEIQKSVLIGVNTLISDGVKISNTILGANCKINSNVSISDSHIGNRVEIGEGCILNRCILSDGTIWKDTNPHKDKLILDGQVFPIELPTQSPDESESEEDSDLEVDNLESGDETEFGALQDEDFKIFSLEVMQSLLRAFRQTVADENLRLEINGSKFAYNMSFKELTIAIAKGILNVAPKVHPEFYEELSPKAQWEKIKEVVMKLKGVVAHYVTTKESQRDLIQALEEYANDNTSFRPMLIKILHLLYDEDILPEEAILLWHKSPSLYDAGAELRVMVKQLIEWLEASDSDSDEEE